MTNWKDEVSGKAKQKKKTPARQSWKKVENVAKAISRPSPKKRDSAATSSGVSKKEPEAKEEVAEEDPYLAYRTVTYETIKNGFSLAFGEGDLKINVDNIYPLLKILQLNPKNESILDMVRTACIETFGDIDPKDFDNVVLSLIKLQDEELWKTREIEKMELDRKRRDRKEKAALVPKLDDQPKPDWEPDDDPPVDEDNPDSTKKLTADEIRELEERNDLEKEKTEDELYDNMKMAFKFIDTDNDGIISVQDIYNVMFGLGEVLSDDELFSMFQTADVDSDGRITYEDFVNFLSGSPESVSEEVEEAKEADEAEQASQEAEEQQAPEPEPEAPPSVPEVTEATAEERAAREKRKKSLVWGYMTAAAKTVALAEQQKDKEKQKDVENVTQSQKAEATEEAKSNDTVIDTQSQGDALQEGPSQLHAIHEEEEHSDYEASDTKKAHSTYDQDKAIKLENKRKLFSRNNSAASLKNRAGSIVTVSESTIEDSGIDTFDGSELREQRDVFDFSEDEGLGDDVELDKVSAHASTVRQSSRASREEIAEEFAGSSPETSPRSPSRLTKENLSAVGEGQLFQKSRTIQFVNSHMYQEIEHEPTESELEEEAIVQTRFDRAAFLQKAIIRRSNTEPRFKMTAALPKQPPLPVRTNANGVCSHINIDLTCNSPPKAEIRSYKQFSSRVNSARGRQPTQDSVDNGGKMTVVDMNDAVEAERVLSRGDLYKWPMRPLTRPKSATVKRVLGLSEDSPIKVVPAGSVERPSTATSKRPLQRPQTANIPYTRSNRYTPPPGAAISNSKVNVTVSAPFGNADQLYPGKSALTTHHHGFKSIWPIGRKINVLQTKRPFSAFEMNSYSRAIERQEHPFRNDGFCPRSGTGGESEVKVKQRPPSGSKKSSVIQLELATERLARPKVKRMSMLMHRSFPLASVR